MLPYEDPFTLSLLFHTNSEPWGNVAAYHDPHVRMEFKSVGERRDAVPLPAAAPSPLVDLIARRQSCRDFSQEAIALEDLAALLAAGYGVTGLRKWPNGHRTLGRAVPSAGGVYPLELYVVCNRVEGVAAGIYHFNVRELSLEPLDGTLSISEMLPDLMYQGFLEPASALCLITGTLPRTLRKYGARGYRYVLIETGHVAQNMVLRAAELGLATLCAGGFTDTRLNRRLKLGGGEVALYGVAVGHRSRRDSTDASNGG